MAVVLTAAALASDADPASAPVRVGLRVRFLAGDGTWGGATAMRLRVVRLDACSSAELELRPIHVRAPSSAYGGTSSSRLTSSWYGGKVLQCLLPYPARF